MTDQYLKVNSNDGKILDKLIYLHIYIKNKYIDIYI